MLKNKNLNIIFAIVIAVSLWAYVLGDVNPTTSVTIKDVPVKIINQETLTDLNMVILECSDDTIDITIMGPRTEVTKVKQSDFKVVADVEGLKHGNNVVRLNVKGPDNIEITNISTDKITVTVDELISVNKEISVVSTGSLDDDMEPYIVDIAKDIAKVSGAKTLINRVDRVNAVIDTANVDNSMKTVAARLEAVDEEGNVVEGVILESDTVNVTVVMHHKKTVNLEVPIVNMDANDFERSISVPKTIVIKGEDEALKKIDTIKCEAIDLSLYTENTKVKLKPIIPNGVQVSSSSADLYAEVIVKEYGSVVIKVSTSDIKLLNTSNELNYEIEEEDLTLTIQGKESELEHLSISDFNITADVNDLEAGSHKVKVKINCEKNIGTIKSSFEEIVVVIK